MPKTSRKDFLTKTLYLVTSLSLVEGGFGFSSSLVAKEKLPETLPEGSKPVPESDPTAKALGFHQDAKHTDFTLYPERKDPGSKNQFCKHCAQYTKINEKWGKCNIISSGLVSSQGWCSAWSLKS
ncbi:high-potential iron-sulfur protein [Leptospira kanakyensis]|uniref:High-potential iron-sulfur protein n=1 Tax=Leptospira kanakyensis TaxID=2484968 RepID=A0A6N4Q7M5_9LEPT|nr:high-potential iron-sulfur protein [Leptospira kanakyensis]MCW7468151.1 high-potential iron-sulfur protein [Leptospira kanakyensis]MCW7482315.1 high-potential iron-sulfur protein [Leptospira kanakyensis]TGK49221.1 high-potential iron-sulfur protein [Leptospira kanakyensis]TGK60538.1 high-potential iron-sulfur protein [Leptospira kanakyensis]TGK67938.1 high-potential iron-sulfur protein [Leptospira kanakyensis]